MQGIESAHYRAVFAHRAVLPGLVRLDSTTFSHASPTDRNRASDTDFGHVPQDPRSLRPGRPWQGAAPDLLESAADPAWKTEFGGHTSWLPLRLRPWPRTVPWSMRPRLPKVPAASPDIYWGDWFFVHLLAVCWLFMWGIGVLNLLLRLSNGRTAGRVKEMASRKGSPAWRPGSEPRGPARHLFGRAGFRSIVDLTLRVRGSLTRSVRSTVQPNQAR